MRTTLLRLLLGGAASVALLASCGGGGFMPNSGEVRLVNATSEFQALDLYEDDDRMTPGVAPFAAGTYEDLNKGAHTLSVRGGVAGATLATLDADVPEDTHLAIVAYSSGGTPTLTMIEEEEESPEGGSAKLRFFNTAGSDSGPVDIYLLDVATACSTLTATAPPPIATDVSGLQTSYTTIHRSPAEGYRLCVTAADDKADLRLDSVLIVDDRKVVNVIFSRTSGVLLNGIFLEQRDDLTPALNTSARVSLAVGVSNGAVATASIASVSLGASAASGTVTPYKLVPAGTVNHLVEINATPVSVGPITLVGGADYTFLVAGSAGDPTVKLMDDNNTLSTDDAKPVKIRLVNGTNGARTGNFGPALLTVGSTLLDSTEFAEQSPYDFVESSTQTSILFAVRTTNDTVLCTSLAPVSAGVFTVFVLGDPPEPPADPPICLRRTDR